MELKLGYKQTEVGVIPEDWDVRPLSNISLKIMVGIASAATHAYRLSGIPMIRNQNIKPGHLLDSDLLFIDQEYEKTYRNKRLLEGDLLTTRTGYPGTTCIVPAKYKAAQSFTTLITRPDTAQITSKFLCLYINSEHGQRFFESSQIGGAQKNVNTGTLKKMPIPIPTVSEQTKVSNVFGAVEELLATLKNLIAKKRALKQAAMQELLTGKRRLPGFEGEWGPVSLGSVAPMNSGGTPPTSRDDFYGGGIPWVSITDMTTSGRFISETERTLSDLGLANCAAKRFPAGTILYAMYASLGECSIAAREVTTSQAILGIRPGPSLVGEYLYYWLESIRGAVKLMGQQGTQSNLNKKIVQGFSLKLPSKPEQAAIAKALGEIDQDIDALKDKAEKTRAMNSGMMQQLLTGKIRLT